MTNNNTKIKSIPLTEVKEALELVLDSAEDFGVERVHLKTASGRVLKENIFADRDLPPFDRVSMDGIAFRFEDFKKGHRSFRLEGIQAAGSAQKELNGTGGCLEAMTGSMLPSNADVVVPYEQVIIEGETATVLIEEVKWFQNIHKKGLDRKENDLLIRENTVIGGAEIGVLASVGKSEVLVARLPKIAIISTGDELVRIDETPLPFQIRRSNVHSLSSLMNDFQIEPDLYHLSDDRESLLKKVRSLLAEYDVLMFSGAVSKGKFDYLPGVLEELEVKKLFHRVRQRPGKPFWFGKKESTTIFAFPGNPVSTFVSCLKYFVPWLDKSLGIDSSGVHMAQLKEDFEFKPELTYFLQVKLVNEGGTLYALPVVGNGSGDLANLVLNDAFLELPAQTRYFKKGDAYPYISFRDKKFT